MTRARFCRRDQLTRAGLETTLRDLMAPASRLPRANAAGLANHQERTRDGHAGVINHAGRSALSGRLDLAFKTSKPDFDQTLPRDPSILVAHRLKLPIAKGTR